MPKSPEAFINPKILTWAREATGFTLPIAAKKLHVKEGKLISWENGDEKPSLAKLRDIANKYKFPTAIFYLPAEPEKPKLPEDFRRAHVQHDYPLSSTALLQIRRAREHQNISFEISEDANLEFQRINIHASLQNDPETLASKVRGLLTERLKNQHKWSGLYDGLKHWREILEQFGVLVSFAQRLDKNELSAFSIYHEKFPAIVINSKDHPRRKLFSLLHELGHILLRNEGICETFSETSLDIEKFCNHFAGAALVPRDSLLNESEIVAGDKNTEWDNETLLKIASHYGVSREVILRRLLILEKTTRTYYENWRKRNVRKEMTEYEDMFGDEFREKYVNKVLRTNGENFTRIVLAGLWANKITINDTLGYLDISVQHFKKLQDTIISKMKTTPSQ